jgi:hypothetical protein
MDFHGIQWWMGDEKLAQILTCVSDTGRQGIWARAALWLIAICDLEAFTALNPDFAACLIATLDGTQYDHVSTTFALASAGSHVDLGPIYECDNNHTGAFDDCPCAFAERAITDNNAVDIELCISRGFIMPDFDIPASVQHSTRRDQLPVMCDATYDIFVAASRLGPICQCPRGTTTPHWAVMMISRGEIVLPVTGDLPPAEDIDDFAFEAIRNPTFIDSLVRNGVKPSWINAVCHAAAGSDLTLTGSGVMKLQNAVKVVQENVDQPGDPASDLPGKPVVEQPDEEAIAREHWAGVLRRLLNE